MLGSPLLKNMGVRLESVAVVEMVKLSRSHNCPLEESRVKLVISSCTIKSLANCPDTLIVQDQSYLPTQFREVMYSTAQDVDKFTLGCNPPGFVAHG